MTVHKDSVVKIDKDIPFETAAIMGCAVPTGFGSATNVAQVQPGETVVIVGVGGIGMSALQGAVISGATHRHRDRPQRVEARPGDQVRRHPRLPVDGRGYRADDRRHPRADGRQDHHRGRRDEGRVRRRGDDPHRQDRHLRGDGHGLDDGRRRQAQPVPVHHVAEDVEGQHLRRRQLGTSKRRELVGSTSRDC